MEPQELVEHRYRAVLEVLDGAPLVEVALRYGVSRQSVHTWRNRYRDHGIEGLKERSRRPRSSPTRLRADVEALICELRQQHPRWGARRIVHELGRRHVDPSPSRATVHRVLARNGLVDHQQQEHKRKYRRWQRDAPMQLWQMDIVSGIPLADGRECKLVTGIDDHSRFLVVAEVVVRPTGRDVCSAFMAAMQRYGVPTEVLTDNGKQFTGRFTKPRPAEVIERILPGERDRAAAHQAPLTDHDGEDRTLPWDLATRVPRPCRAVPVRCGRTEGGLTPGCRATTMRARISPLTWPRP